MLLDNFTCSGLCCLMKWNCFFKPRGLYHSFFTLFNMSAGVFYQKADAVDQTDADFLLISERHFYCLFRYEFRFNCRDQFSGST